MEQHALRTDLAARVRSLEEGRPRLRREADVPVLEARQGGLAEKVESLIHRVYPFLASIVTSYVLSIVLTGVAIAGGLLLMRLLLPIGALGQLDERFPAWLEGQRTPLLDDVSYGASLVGADVLILLVSVSTLAFAFRRHWRMAGFLVAAILVEVSTYRVTAEVVGRERPDVIHLDPQLDPNHSFPSGHVAASVAVYGGLALLLMSRFKSFWFRTGVGALALAIPALVGLSRIYRGEHHPTDVVGGAVLGIGALLIGVFATRTGIVAGERRALRERVGGRS
jgi:membrane-associated phospholipid phosphatase